MRSTIVVLVAAALASAGCYTTVRQSTVGPFVRAIDAHRDGIVVESCSIKRYEEVHHNFLNFVFGTQPEQQVEFTQDRCSGGFLSLAPPPATPAARTAP